jgi:glutamate racemase
MKEMNKSRPIGVFDSGVGGLSVLRQLVKDYPNESFIYLGDTARLPYGTKSKETIVKYANKNLKFLVDNFSIKALVVACNSVSTVIDEIDSKVPIFGVIKPGARAALSSLNTGDSIGLWATQATVQSGAYVKEIKNINNNVSVSMVSCPTLVALVEEGLDKHPLLEAAFDYYINQFDKKVDVLILGCTHFPFFKELLAKKFPKIKLIDSSISLSEDLKSSLDLKGEKTETRTVKILLTDEAKSFKDFVYKIFKHEIEIEKIDIQ